jgi:hypothetical protein
MIRGVEALGGSEIDDRGIERWRAATLRTSS